ncbi:(2Fe-2S)-binding protein [Caldimonas caldifontis]|uniref:Bacterioferritin-associated ferredoxin n=1 Tax=Caldimonas caldifontis TaxID=1452508 RepID=A0A2S5SY73_9BURK|nr:(2Fe-2S)-binding protein [Caldimonas caldifontis]PPE67723.1 (2Fe-2S)-binding protein [Caldimonas caldifontis]
MIVCVCRRVSERDIQRAALGGCASLEELQMELGVATCCGRCADCAQATLEACAPGRGMVSRPPATAGALVPA